MNKRPIAYACECEKVHNWQILVDVCMLCRVNVTIRRGNLRERTMLFILVSAFISRLVVSAIRDV